MSFATDYRPRRFSDMVGQEGEIEAAKTILSKEWHPNAISITGAYGTGKTCMVRLIARATLCYNRDGVEPCGECSSCRAIDNHNNPNYLELDSASRGSVQDVRELAEELSYRSSGDRPRIVCYDEAHMLSQAAQGHLLKDVEEGIPNVIFVFVTTDVDKLLPTLRSRCIGLRTRLLTASELAGRVTDVARLEGFSIEPTAVRLIATYARGHARDALMTLEQLHKVEGDVTEELTRTYLRVDSLDEMYKLLCMEKKDAVEKLEALLCEYAPVELRDKLGEALTNCYKVSLGLPAPSQADSAFIQKVFQNRDEEDCLKRASQVLNLRDSYPTIQAAQASFLQALSGGEEASPGLATRRKLGGAKTAAPVVMSKMRKPGK